MSVISAYTYADVDMFADVNKHPVYPLYICGIWHTKIETTGDATAGYLQQIICPLPQTPKLPYLPNLDAYFTVLGIGVRAAAAMYLTLQMYNDYYLAGNAQIVIAETCVASHPSPAGVYGWEGAQSFQKWLGRVKNIPVTGSGSIRLTYDTNTNLAAYRMDAHGLILKTREQLITESLWPNKIKG